MRRRSTSAWTGRTTTSRPTVSGPPSWTTPSPESARVSLGGRRGTGYVCLSVAPAAACACRSCTAEVLCHYYIRQDVTKSRKCKYSGTPIMRTPLGPRCIIRNTEAFTFQRLPDGFPVGVTRYTERIVATFLGILLDLCRLKAPESLVKGYRWPSTLDDEVFDRCQSG